MKVFVSYSHVQGDWVLDRLVPCLKAGGAEVLIDVERFRSGGALYRQMDTLQGEAQRHVLVLSAAYLASPYCVHEMQQAVALDPLFDHHLVQPVRLDDTELPPSIKAPEPIYVDLRDDTKPAPWALLLRECGADLGTTAPAWLTVRDALRRLLDDRKSVNFVVDRGVKWQALVDEISNRPNSAFPLLAMNNPEAGSRRSLIRAMLNRTGFSLDVQPPPDDLAALSAIERRSSITMIGLVRFDYVAGRSASGYDKDLHGALRYLVTEGRPGRLQLLVQSHAPFADLLPGHEFNSKDFLEPLVLKAIP